MVQSVKQIADRLIICGLGDISNIFEKQPIGAIFSICDELVMGLAKEEFDFSQTIHIISSFEDQIFYLFSEANDNKEAIFSALRKDLEIATDLLSSADDQKVLFHCHGGMHLSPSFVFLLLCHIQRDNPDFDLALMTTKKIRPQANLSTALAYYAPYFGQHGDKFVKSLKDFKLASKLQSCSTQAASESLLAQHFGQEPKPNAAELSQIFIRFGMEPTALRL